MRYHVSVVEMIKAWAMGEGDEFRERRCVLGD